MIAIDRSKVRPDAALTYPHFIVVRDRLYRVSRDTQSEEVVTQLLVPRSRREMVFQAAHYNPMPGHLGYEKTLDRIMARFYWPGIRAEVRRWCASCPECQLVNPPAVPRASLRPLPLVEAPFYRVGMDIIGPLEHYSHGSICVDPHRLRNPIPGSNSVVQHLREECCADVVSCHIAGGSPERDSH